MVKISPSILSADFSRLGDEIKKVEKYSDMLHVDVMDGHFVPNITFGPPMVKSIKKATHLPLDVHLMIENPEKYILAFAEAGADMICFHAETVKDIGKTVEAIKKSGAKVAIALNPATPVSKIEKFVGKVDMVLLMTVNPGFGGQKFIEDVLPKIEKLRKFITDNKLQTDIEVDGGINKETASLAKKAGANVLVAGSYIYGSTDISAAIRSLKD